MNEVNNCVTHNECQKHPTEVHELCSFNDTRSFIQVLTTFAESELVSFVFFYPWLVLLSLTIYDISPRLFPSTSSVVFTECTICSCWFKWI